MSTSSSLLSTLSPSSNSSNQNNITDEERRRYLDLLQEETTLLMIPTVVFLGVIGIVGLFGNSMVLLVYSRKPRPNATDVFIMAIAAFDLTTNVLAIPGEIYDTFHQWDIDKPAMCRCRLYVNAFTTMSSALVLLAVAVCRYKKVCRPLGKQISIGTAKCLIPAMALVCSICAAPQAILAGSQTVPTGHEDISGYLCLTDDKYDGTIWPIIYSGFMMLLFLGTCIPLIVLYVQIAIQAWHHSKRHGVSMTSMSATNSDATATETLDSNDDKRKRKSNNRRFKFLKNNEDFDIRRGNSSTEENLKVESIMEMKKTNKNKRDQSKTYKTEQEEAMDLDTFHPRKIWSPSKGTKIIDLPMLQKLTSRLHRINNEQCYTDETAVDDPAGERSSFGDASKMQTLTQTSVNETPAQRYERTIEGSQKFKEENSTFGLLDVVPASMQGDGPTLFLKDEGKTEDFGIRTDVANGKTSDRSEDFASDSNLRETMADTHKTEIKVRIEKNAKNDNRDNDNFSFVAASTFAEKSEITDRPNGAESHFISKINSDQSTCTSKTGTLKRSQARKKDGERKLMTRTTIMLLIISTVYIIGFVPYLVLSACRLTVPNFIGNMSSTYHVFLRFYFINSAANAIIYGFCDVRFRKEVWKICWCWQRSSLEFRH